MQGMDDILEKPAVWLGSDAAHSDVVLSSRVRLARNLRDYPFPNHASGEILHDVLAEAKQAVRSNSEFSGGNVWELNQLSSAERRLLFERRLISAQFAEEYANGAVVLDDGCRLSIMINEEDHFRIQILGQGLNLLPLWERIGRLDCELGDELNFAFDESFGYLTSCPSNVGTGLRLSVMMHLPALTMMGELSSIVENREELQIAVRGFYGEGSDVVGRIYQISNSLSLGWTGPDLLQGLLKIAQDTVDKEFEARRKLLDTQRIDVEDRVFRSLGTLERARKLSLPEFIGQYSNLMLGISTGIISEIDPLSLHGLLLWVQPAHIQWHFGEEMCETERDVCRADLVRSRLGL